MGEGLPAFTPGTQVQLEGPGVAWLAVQVPIVLGNVLGIEDPILILGRVLFGEAVTDEIGIVGTVFEHECFDRTNLAFDLYDQCDYVFFLACITSKSVSFASGGLDGIY